MSTGAIQERIFLLRQLFVMSQTESLMLDEGNLEEVQRIASYKNEIVNRIAGHSEAVADSPEAISLRREALELISRINIVDTGNQVRLEKWRSESLHCLQLIQEQRILKNAYKNEFE